MKNALFFKEKLLFAALDVLVGINEQGIYPETQERISLLACEYGIDLVISFLNKLQSIFLTNQKERQHTENKRIRKMKKWLEENHANPILLENISAESGMSRTGFSRAYKQLTGDLFSDYLTEIRIRKACLSLLRTDDSVMEVAYQHGFNSDAYFVNVFRKKKGVTPQNYRKMFIDNQERFK